MTVYAAGLELFMEWPTFVVGQPSPLVAHFTATNPDGFSWVTSGAVVATLRYADGTEEGFPVDQLLRNGIFKPVVTPTRAGQATLTLRLSGDIAGTVPVGDVKIFADVAAALADEPTDEPGEPTVAYLKESQWKTTYATTEVGLRTLRGSVRATGEINAPPDARAVLGSPISGRLEGTALLQIGAEVHPGDVLARVIGLGAEDRAAVDVEIAEAEAQLALAQQAASRAESLHPAVISSRELEASRINLELARKRLAAIQGRGRAWSGSGAAGATLRAPIAGRVAFVRSSPGGVVAAGDPVVEIVRADQLWLTAHVFAADAAAVRGSSGAMFSVAGRAGRVVIDAASGGALLAEGSAIDLIDRTLPMVFRFQNPGDLLPGSYADVRVFTAERRDVVAVPAAAIVDDGGMPVVYVMSGGESFFKRRVRVGVLDGDWVEILEGVAVGERVVSKGAYEVLLATSAGGIPAHGHQH